MNLKCLICSDLFTPHSDIRTTPCGHLFHHHCLSQWIERSRTCPQCRNKSTEKTILKIYLSVEETAEELDAGTLQNKLDNLQFQMSLREKDVKIANEKYQTAKKQNVGLREEVKEQENNTRRLESALHALKEQIAYFKSKSNQSNKLEEEIQRLRDQLRNMDHVQTVLTGTRDQVNDMLRNNRDPQSLAILVSTLKKELIDSDKRRKQMHIRLKEAQNESQNYKVELTQLNKQCNFLQQEVEAHKNCETERRYLKRKIDDLSNTSNEESSYPLNNSIRRIMTESPIALPKLTQFNYESTSTNYSPSVPETVQAIKDSNSPFLQSGVIGYSGIGNYNSMSQPRPASTITHNKYSIFKQPSLTVQNMRRPSAPSSYDGLGGHTKEDYFPSPQPHKPNLKRHKSSSTITSAKFRKLAPIKKLNEYFNDSQSNCGD